MSWLIVLLMTYMSEGFLLPVGTCAQPNSVVHVANLTMSVSMVEEVCLVKLDMRVASFDNQLEWLQSTLLEGKCRQSDWLIVVFSHARHVSPTVMDVVSNHAVVDLVVSDFPLSADRPPYISNGILEITKDKLSVYSICEASDPPLILFPQTSRRIDFRKRKVFSRTSWTNIWISVSLAFLNGLVVNIAIRKMATRKELYWLLDANDVP